MKRAQAIKAIEAAGSLGDRQAFMRLYVENRISLPVANDAWRRGQRLAQFVQQRDALA